MPQNNSTTFESASTEPFEVNNAVRTRYSAAAKEAEASLCCPVDYDPQYLKIIPTEILEKDYGCGDPSKYVNEGDVVLDLGSGGGKICYIAAQIVGKKGKVIGVDYNDDMLSLARKYHSEMVEKLGYDVVEFRKGRIQDLSLNLELLDAQLSSHPISNSTDWVQLHETTSRLRKSSPLVESDSVDVIVSNCVLNLVDEEARRQLFEGMFRVLNKGGRAVISDIVCDEDVPTDLKEDAELWSGCLSGAHREDLFLKAFEEAGFYGVEIIERQSEPWAVIEGIEFRSLTVQAWKGKEGPCLDRRQAMIYKGPWKAVIDDDGHKLLRGERMAVCEKTFNLYSKPPYADQMIPIEPINAVPPEKAIEFSCNPTTIRSAAETKQNDARLDILPGNSSCCGEDNCC